MNMCKIGDKVETTKPFMFDGRNIETTGLMGVVVEVKKRSVTVDFVNFYFNDELVTMDLPLEKIAKQKQDL